MRTKRFVAHGDSLLINRMAFALTLPPRRVRCNKEGDWIGYEGRERVYNFKDNADQAKNWAERVR